MYSGALPVGTHTTGCRRNVIADSRTTMSSKSGATRTFTQLNCSRHVLLACHSAINWRICSYTHMCSVYKGCQWVRCLG